MRIPLFYRPFYANDAAFDGSARRSAAQLCLLMDRGGRTGGTYPSRPSYFSSQTTQRRRRWQEDEAGIQAVRLTS